MLKGKKFDAFALLCLIKSPFRAFECRFKAFEQTFPNNGTEI